ncbi:amidohydrolase, partial [bacterium]|nr:amidohydrolase [bacterium]
LVRNGRIAAVGRGLDAPGNALVLDGTGMHVTPGLIDCHSHSSIEGGVNECTQSCTAGVRIADVVDANSAAIYRELAGGLTISNLLHGSCNPIGGQNAVIKLRWGAPAADLLLAGAPGGIKFALGENVTRANWDTKEKRDRYPNTRMGVEQFLRDRFHAAEDYRHEWDEWRAARSGPAPRRDLELDALVEILQGDRLVHCHSYRADEIIMLMRVAEDFGFRVGTFQHVLEGYKAANEMAVHGAGASAFSDWWAYKYEVVDAIPYNGEIMWRRGVTVSFNSDSAELSRRMNLEAAKAVKYGDVPEAEALKFVTWNPAVQLGIDGKVGSLEPGKDADFVLWSAHPLSDFAVCRQTWIDGVKRFDIDEDRVARRQAAELRERLLAKAEKAGKRGGAGGGRNGQGRQRDDVEMPQGVCGERSCCAGAGQ